MALYRRGRIWYVSFHANGKRIQESTKTSNRREAEKFRALRMSEAQRGEYAPQTRMTFAEFGEKYMDYAEANKRSWLRDQQLLVHLNARMGKMQLSEIGAF